MIVLLCFAFIIIPWLFGRSFLTVFGGKSFGDDIYRGDFLLTGYIICIGLAEAAHFVGAFLGRSFSDCVKLFVLLCGFVSILSVIILTAGLLIRRRRWGKLYVKKEREPLKKYQIFFGIVMALVIISQFLFLIFGDWEYRQWDMTPETVESFLHTNGIYTVNPLTGSAYTAGMPSRIKILCLPFLYAALCDLFGVSTQLLLFKLVPALVLVLAYVAYYGLARFFFPKDGEKRCVFVLIVALLFWAGSFLYGVEGFDLLYAGYAGVTLRGAVLLPMVVRACLQKRPMTVILCILAEACTVWTLYGAGQCLFVAVCLAVVSFGSKLWQKNKELKEAGSR